MRLTGITLVLAAAIIVVPCVSLVAQDGNKPEASKTDSLKAGHNEKCLYTCSMHPDVHSDKPGKCPECGMALVKCSDEAVSMKSKKDCKDCKEKGTKACKDCKEKGAKGCKCPDKEAKAGKAHEMGKAGDAKVEKKAPEAVPEKSAK